MKEYDYSQPGSCFITICTHNRECLLGKIKNGKVEWSVAGQIIEKWLVVLPNKFTSIKVNGYIIMPKHFHGIITIVETKVGADLRVCPNNTGKDMDLQGEHIGSPLRKIIQWFKTMTTNDYIRGVKYNGSPSFHSKFWQRNYYEHIIRNEDELQKIREYIQNNPLKWHLDRENPERIDKDALEHEIFRHTSD
ncbi:MAG: transposase [Thermodesulfobacteriota bacterium]